MSYGAYENTLFGIHFFNRNANRKVSPILLIFTKSYICYGVSDVPKNICSTLKPRKYFINNTLFFKLIPYQSMKYFTNTSGKSVQRIGFPKISLPDTTLAHVTTGSEKFWRKIEMIRLLTLPWAQILWGKGLWYWEMCEGRHSICIFFEISRYSQET